MNVHFRMQWNIHHCNSQQATIATVGKNCAEVLYCATVHMVCMCVLVCTLELMSMGQGNATYWHFTQTTSSLVTNRGNTRGQKHVFCCSLLFPPSSFTPSLLDHLTNDRSESGTQLCIIYQELWRQKRKEGEGKIQEELKKGQETKVRGRPKGIGDNVIWKKGA